MNERVNNAIQQFAENHSKFVANEFKLKKKLSNEDMECIKSYRRKIKKLLGSINTNYSYRELSLAKTKLEESEMWLSKLIKERETK